MNNFTVELWDDEGARCTFYTVKWEDSVVSETDKFFNKYYAKSELKLPIQQLLSFILDSIGNDYGAIDCLFNRFEKEVIGLPNKGKATIGEITFLFPNFPLRLFALRINNRNDLVVLFNGGLKSGQTIQQSRDLHLKWIEACRFARRIEEALFNKEIVIDSKNRKIMPANNEDSIIL